jgi:uncharacterized protein (DUF1330 family)
MAGYIVIHIEVHDPEAYEAYRARVRAVIGEHDGRFIARGQEPEVVEGDWPGKRTVILEFPLAEAARGFWDSPAYGELRELRQRASRFDAVIVDGA